MTYLVTAHNCSGFEIVVLKDIADEERVHAGEFLKLLHYLVPEEARLYEKGAKEVDGILSEVQKK